MSRRIGLVVFLLCAPFAPGAFGDAAFFFCVPTVSLTGPDLLDTCPGAGLAPGSNVTAIKLYLLADFQDGAPGVRDLIHVIFAPSVGRSESAQRVLQFGERQWRHHCRHQHMRLLLGKRGRAGDEIPGGRRRLERNCGGQFSSAGWED